MTFHADEYQAAAGRYRGRDAVPPGRAIRARPAGHLARPLAQLRRRRADRADAGHPAPGVRPGGHPLRPRQQLRAALRLGRAQLRHASSRATSGPTATSSSSRARRATTCGRAPTARAAARASTSSPRATSPCSGWAWTTSTSSTATASTRRRRSRRRMGALDALVRQGKALYVGISSYSGARTREAVEILRSMGTPLLIHQPSYSMLNRWIEEDLLDAVGETGRRAASRSRRSPRGCSPTSTSTASRRARAPHRASRSTRRCSPRRRCGTSGRSTEMARARGQSLAQMALAWALRDQRVTSVLIGASSVEQLDDSLDAVQHLTSAPRSSPRSTSTPSTPGSTSGRPRATRELRPA